MKKLTKIAAVISIIAVMLSLSVVQSFAATETQNDIEFSFVTDKTDYTDGEKITATIEIANNGDEDVSNVKVATAVPDGYAFADAKMAEQTVDVIHPQKTAKFTAEFVVKTSVDTTAPVDSGVEVTTPVSPDSASDAVSATSDQTSNSSVKTGALNIVIAVALAMILVSAAVFGFIKFRRQTTGVLSVLLCATVIFGTLPVIKAAETTEEEAEKERYRVSLEQDVTVASSPLKLSASDKTDLLTSGTVFVLPESDEYIGGLALKVKEKKVENGKVVLTCEEPTLEETVSEFDFAGNAVALVDKVETPDGITASYDENGKADENAFDLDYSASRASMKYTFAEAEFDNGLSASGALTVSIPDITAKVKGKVCGGFSIEELLLTFTTKVEVSGNLSYDFGIPETSVDSSTREPIFGSGKTELATIPFMFAGGFGLEVVFFVNLDVSGTASISYAIQETAGMQYKDGAFRTIKDTSSEFKAFEANASAKIGLGAGLELMYATIFPIIGFDVHCGLGVTIKFVVHTDVSPTLCCGDGSVYLYLTLELDENTIVASVLKNMFHIEISWDIFDEDSSSLKLKLHTENLKWIKTGCTYGKGSILGVVKAQDTGEAIGGAQVKIYQKSTGNLVASGYTKSFTSTVDGNVIYTGEYLVQNLGAGDYEFAVTATGYKKASVDVKVEAGQRVVCEATMMLFRDGMEDEGTVSGRITNALTGSLVSNDNYCVRSGLNNSSGNVIASGKVNSPYSISLAPGYYSITFSKDGFVDETVSVSIASDSNTAKNIAMAPTSDITIADSSFRAVLTWGQYPYDLDSHMRFTSSSPCRKLKYYKIKKDLLYFAVLYYNLLCIIV